MDNDESTITPVTQYKEDIASIKKCLESLVADLTEVKCQVKKQTELVSDRANSNSEFMQKWNSREDFIRFDDEISNVSTEFKTFLEILKKLYTINANAIEKNLNKYFKTVLNALFGKNLLQDISWGKYCDKLSVKNSTVIDAIQRSGAIVDDLSTEYSRLKVLQKEYTKYKDAKRDRCAKSRPMIPHDNVEFFDVSSLQQQEPDLMINGNEIIEIEVATTEEVEDLLSPTYTDENTVHETFDEDISVFTIQNDVSNDEADGNDANSVIFDEVSKDISPPNYSDAHTIDDAIADQENDGIGEYISTNELLNCAEGEILTSLEESTEEDHSSHSHFDHTYVALLNNAHNNALAENEPSSQIPHQNKTKEMGKVKPKIIGHEANKGTSHKNRIPLSVNRTPKVLSSIKAKIRKEKLAQKLRRKFIARSRQNAKKPKPSWDVKET